MSLSRPTPTVKPSGLPVGSTATSRALLLLWRVLALALLVGISLLILYPALWMLSTALKSDAQVFTYPPVWIPSPPQWHNFVDAWYGAPFTRYTINTTLYALVVTAATVLANSFVAYGFAKLRFPGRDVMFAVMLASMMIPGMVTMIPQYILFSKLGWVGTYLPLVVPSFFASAFFTFMLRQYFLTVPNELSEAARVDGASELWIWWRVVMPLATPALATVAIFTFDGTWNSYVGPLLYLNDEKLYTLQVGLQFFRNGSQTQWQHLMAASLLVMLPVVAIFFAFQKYFVEGASLSGSVKG
ncbi:carbohydrate ABC transporter permease [Deinococcus pimensis]|uniref:carbohydrate ABC transporter permease n=1 Tax=Deinococcus pimensis TaxID=309888 RepID=UPI0004B51978|nr:carbohydrate ABC transporter permease [Deinococcus pimensis]